MKTCLMILIFNEEKWWTKVDLIGKWEVDLTSLEQTREDHRHHGIVEDNKCQTCVGFDSVIPVLRQLHPFFHLPKDEIPLPTWTRDKLRGMRLPYLTLPYITLEDHIYIYMIYHYVCKYHSIIYRVKSYTLIHIYGNNSIKILISYIYMAVCQNLVPL